MSAANGRFTPPLLPFRPVAGFPLGRLVGRDDPFDLLRIERLNLIVMHGNRNQRTARPVENMMRSADSHQCEPGPFQLFSDFREPNWTRHESISYAIRILQALSRRRAA